MPDTRNNTLAGLLGAAFDRWAGAHMLGAMPAKVERFVAAKNEVDVTPIIREPDMERPQVIVGVPLVQLGAGGFRLTFPVAVGDVVLLVFGRRSLDKWKALGGQDVNPNDTRQLHRSDAIAIPGLRSFAEPWTGTSTSALTLGEDGSDVQVHVTGTDVLIGGTSATHAIATAEKVATELNALKSTLQTWVPVPGDGGAALKTLLTALFTGGWPGSVAAGLGKVKP